MNCKWIGAALIVLACGGFGLKLAFAHKREEWELSCLIAALDYMTCELHYRMTPLPELCRRAGKENKGAIGAVFTKLADELDSQISPDVSSCMRKALSQSDTLQDQTAGMLRLLGQSLGRFDLEGQIQGLTAVRTQCRAALDRLGENREFRLRNYQTLGFCAGAAIAILFI